MPLNWINDQPRLFYSDLVDSNDPIVPALDGVLDIIENTPSSAASRPRSIAAGVSPPPVWLVDVRHGTRDLQLLWQEDDHGDPMPLWIGESRFPAR